MLKEFIDFVNSVLPAVSPDFRDGAKEAITQFEKEGEQPKFMTLNPLDSLSQGDIVSSLPFVYFEKDGKQKNFFADALVINTSCHIDNKKKLTFVPVFPIEEFNGNSIDLKKNTIYDYMYISDGVLSDKFVDFGIVNTYSKELIMTCLKNEKIKRIGSLNQLGYYFFVIKITVYLMRKEDDRTLEHRNLDCQYT